MRTKSYKIMWIDVLTYIELSFYPINIKRKIDK